MERGLNHGVDFALWDFWYTAGTRGILFYPRQAQRQKPLSPELYCGSRNSEGARNVVAVYSVGRHLNDS